MKMKKFMTASAGLLMAFALTACGGGGAGTATTPAASGEASAASSAPMEEGGSVGVSMPTQTSERWIADGEADAPMDVKRR